MPALPGRKRIVKDYKDKVHQLRADANEAVSQIRMLDTEIKLVSSHERAAKKLALKTRWRNVLRSINRQLTEMGADPVVLPEQDC